MQRLFQLRSSLRTAWLLRACVVIGCTLMGSLVTAAAKNDATGAARDHRHDGRTRFVHEMPASIRSDHPAIVPIAAAIRRIATDPLEQLVIVNDVAHLLVDYDDDERVYGCTEFHATLDEMIARRRECGWIYLRDDCDGRAVFAAHVLAALGIQWKLAASYWTQHAWVVARVNGIDYDLLDAAPANPEGHSLGYRVVGRHFVHREQRPPFFAWRVAWRERTRADVETGKILGLLTLDSTRDHLIERHATDWTKVHPDGRGSPLDSRIASTACAGFPYGEALQPLLGRVGHDEALVSKRPIRLVALRTADEAR